MDTAINSEASQARNRPEVGKMEHLAWPTRLAEVPKEVFVRPDIFEAELNRIF